MRPTVGVLVAIASLATACGDDPVTAYFAVPGSSQGDDFYALPFPNDIHRNADGTLNLADLPTNSVITDTVRQLIERDNDGFGLNAAMFTRFSGGLDPASLPTPAESMTDDAAVYVVNIDADSDEVGTRIPVIASFREDGTRTILGNRLVVRPYPGFPLSEGTRYALVLTNRLRAASGGDVERDGDFSALMGTGGNAAIATARAAYAPLVAWLDAPGGDDRDDVVSAAVFTTQHATHIGPALRKGVFAAPAPVARDVAQTIAVSSYSMFRGLYDAPNFQSGDPPYTASGGRISIGADGAAVVQRTEAIRFALSVPSGAVPTNGFPICLYQHGTGGDYISFYDDGTAERLAAEGIAVISMDQVLHGPRDPTSSDPSINFFNLGNLVAGRDNPLQGAADAWSQLRLVKDMQIVDGSRTLKFDASKVSFYGHSQGGLTGPAFIAFEPTLTGAVLSGTGGTLYLSLLTKTEPVNFPELISVLVRDDPIDADNPTLALAQIAVERSDGINYAPFFVRKLRTAEGVTTPRHIYQTEGFTDRYSPNAVIEAFAIAVGGDIVQLPDTLELEGVTLRGRGVVSTPITNNMGNATAVLAQFKQVGSSDGHFVAMDVAAARKQVAKFLGTLAATGQATVVSP